MLVFQEDKTTTSENISEKEENLQGYEFVFSNTLIDFHEPNGYCSDEKTIFAYTEDRRFYM